MKMKTWLILLVGLMLFDIGCTSEDDKDGEDENGTYLGSCSAVDRCSELYGHPSLKGTVTLSCLTPKSEGGEEGIFSTTEKCLGVQFGSCKLTEASLLPLDFKVHYFSASHSPQLEEDTQNECIGDGLGTWTAN